MATSPYTHPAIYKSVIVGGVPSPGVVTLTGHDRIHRWEKQSPKGTVGDFVLNHGRGIAEFTATFFLVDLNDIEDWDDFVRILAASQEGPKAKALSIYHPDLVRNKITDAVVTSIGGVTHDAKNGAQAVVKFLEFQVVRKKPVTKADPAAKTPNKPDPNADVKRELTALTEQFRVP